MASYNQAAQKVLTAEGGYTDKAQDRGNWVCTNQAWVKGNSNNYYCTNNEAPLLVGTNKGISAPALAKHLKRIPTPSDSLSLTTQTVLDIYEVDYWKRIKGDYINSQPVANIYFDAAINHGVSRATKMLQMTLNLMGEQLQEDGRIGTRTLNAINRADPSLLHNYYKRYRWNFYDKIVEKDPGQSIYLNGWRNRLDHFPDFNLMADMESGGVLAAVAMPSFNSNTKTTISQQANAILDDVTYTLHQGVIAYTPLMSNARSFRAVKLVLIGGIALVLFFGFKVLIKGSGLL